MPSELAEEGTFDLENDPLPPFASEENKQLHNMVTKKDEELQQIAEMVEEHKRRVLIMKEHMRNVEHELEHTRALCEVKGEEIKTEQHLAMLAQKEKHRLRADLEKMEKAIQDSQNRLNQVHNQIFNVNEKIEQFKMKMNWKNEELEQWSIAARQKEEDQIALEK